MINISVFKKIFGNSNDRLLKGAKPIIEQINSLSKEMKNSSDHLLRQKTNEFRQRIENGQDLDLILPEAFAVVRERHRKEQLACAHLMCN